MSEILAPEPCHDSLKELRRVALCLEYNGAQYHGWQTQKSGLPTVQKVLQAALSRVADHPVEVVCAGRTDRDVHASHQVVHFDTTASRIPRSWVFGCNTHLPRDISVYWAGEVDPEFHARFSARSRRYHYVIYNHVARPANFADGMSWCHEKLDADRMHKAAQCLLGEHDFSSFRAIDCQSKSPFRFLEFVNVSRYGRLVVIDIKGNAFLHHMVRNIAGVLMTIGTGRQPVEWCQQVLEAKDRKQGGVTAKPDGLFLTHVGYPEHFGIPSSPGAPAPIQAFVGMSTAECAASEQVWRIAQKPETDSAPI